MCCIYKLLQNAVGGEVPRFMFISWSYCIPYIQYICTDYSSSSGFDSVLRIAVFSDGTVGQTPRPHDSNTLVDKWKKFFWPHDFKFVYPSKCQPVNSSRSSVCLSSSPRLSICPSVCPSACPCVCLSICPSVCPCVCLFLRVQASLAARDRLAKDGQHGGRHGTQAPAGGAPAQRGQAEGGRQDALETQVLHQGGEPTRSQTPGNNSMQLHTHREGEEEVLS